MGRNRLLHLTSLGASAKARSQSSPGLGVNWFMSKLSPGETPEPPFMEGRFDSSLEIRRILLLTRLRASAKGMTMEQIVKDCGKVPGWNMARKTVWETVKLVLQSLIDDGLAAAKRRFVLTSRGREYLMDPLRWRIEVGASENVEEKLFWESIYEVFDKAYRRLRSKIQTNPRKAA